MPHTQFWLNSPVVLSYMVYKHLPVRQNMLARCMHHMAIQYNLVIPSEYMLFLLHMPDTCRDIA